MKCNNKTNRQVYIYIHVWNVIQTGGNGGRLIHIVFSSWYLQQDGNELQLCVLTVMKQRDTVRQGGSLICLNSLWTTVELCGTEQ